MISEEQFLKWLWMADWCKDTEISPYKSENWSNAEKAYNDKFNSESEIKLLEEKYGNGDYICVARWEHKSKLWYEQLVDNPFLNNHLDNATEIKLIHKKHKDILDAYLADNSVEIEVYFNTRYILCDGWIDGYSENCAYRLKQQYPIFKRNEDGEVFRFEDSSSYPLAVISNYRIDKYTSDNHNDWSTTPYDKERGLYHLQPVWRYNNQNEVTIDFYSKEVSALLRTEAYKKVEPITPEQLKVMPFVWKMYQQVLKDK